MTLEPTVVHITANSRLTQTLKHAALAQDAVVAETPQIMTLPQWWQQWLQSAWLSGGLAPELLQRKTLSAFEAQWLWEQALESELAHQDDSTPALLNSAATAKQLEQAWSLWNEWLAADLTLEGACDAAQIYESAEFALFKRVARRYEQRLAALGWQDEVAGQALRLAALRANGTGLPARFELHGFDEITPAMQRWRETVEAWGCEVSESSLTLLGSSPSSSFLGSSPSSSFQGALPGLSGARFAAHDRVDEARQAAHWCVQQWQHWRTLKAPHRVRIGVVAPNIESYKNVLLQALDEQLALHGEQPLGLQSGALQPLYNISLGSRLSDLPLVQNALLTLRLFMQPKRPIRYAQWSEWLLSPYTLGEMAERHQADAYLRRLQWANFHWPKLLETASAERLPQPLYDALQRWQASIVPQAAEKLTLSEFVTLAESCLTTLQGQQAGQRRLLPGQTRALNSDEYQQSKAWRDCLGRFKTLNSACGEQPVAYWLGVLQRFVGEMLHQSQSKGLQPIQIMGMLEAGGQQFDALWVLGMTDEAWPRPPQPNPFLPIALQRQYRLPRCDAQRELDYARQISARLAASAVVQVWSYPRFQGEAELMMSPILEKAPFLGSSPSSPFLGSSPSSPFLGSSPSSPFLGSSPSSSFLGASPSASVEGFEIYRRQSYQTLAQRHFAVRSELQWTLDDKGPLIPLGDTAPGGSGILQAQSRCPLMAFIDYRLGARQNLQEVDDGLQSTDQGTLIHEILEHLWQELGQQGALLSLSDEALLAKLQTHIETSFSALRNSFDSHYLQLEQQRILDLLLAWLELERQRPAFSVEQTEQALTVTLAGVDYRLKIDRIDRVGGEWVILDYKTGRASVGDLLKTPIRAPQLAVYLYAAQAAPVAAIGYGLLHSDDGVKLNALAGEDDILPPSRAVTVFSHLAQKEGDYHEVRWSDFLESLKQEVWALAESIQQGEAAMRFDKLADLDYAAGKLALRLPEVQRQLAEVGAGLEENEA